MASTEIVVDDDYCAKMGTYFKQQGEAFDDVIEKYVDILKALRTSGVKDGDFAKALDAYIMYAGKLKNEIGKVSDTVKSQVGDFLTQVDTADSYLF